MRDKISLERCQKLHPRIRQEVIDTITQVECGFPPTVKVRVVQGLRTIAEQNALYAQGRTKPGPKVTNARGGSSYHNYGLAIDFALMYDKDGDGNFEELSWNVTRDFDKDQIGDWQEMVTAFTARGYSWGGNFRTFKDYPHIEKPFGYKPSKLLEKMNAGQTKDGYVLL
jgi:peptidoglycan L-alanyl-D-glutamate endopeptidase CwlK